MSVDDGTKALAQALGVEIKAVRSEVAAGGVALQGELDTLSDVVATKATQANVDAQLAGKASTTDLDNTFTVATDAAALAATKVTGLNGLTGIWRGNKAAYDAITTKDPNVFYVVIP